MTTLSHRTGGARHRRKGNRVEREIVSRHKALCIHAERYPLSGASQFRGSGHDVDLYLFGHDEAPAVAEVKGCKNGARFATLEGWLAGYDALFLRRNNADPLVLLPWRMWARIPEFCRPSQIERRRPEQHRKSEDLHHRRQSDRAPHPAMGSDSNGGPHARPPKSCGRTRRRSCRRQYHTGTGAKSFG
jgi:hypothetical protein